MKEAAGKAKLKLAAVEAADAAGIGKDGAALKDLPQAGELIAAVFAAEPGLENAPLNLGSNGFLWYEVTGVTPEREKPLAEIRDKVLADWKTAQGAERLAAKAAGIAKEVKDGSKTLDAAAAELKLTKETKRGLKRDVEDPEFDGKTVEAAFGGGKGFVAMSGGGSGDTQIVMKVVETYDPTDKSAAAVGDAQKKQAANAISDDLLDQLVAKLQTEFPIVVNQQLINSALANN
jgi:peptidyl-prolyl cis-trans isomerase D